MTEMIAMEILNDPTIVTLTATPSIDVSKSASLVDPNNNGADLGDTIVYTITVTNTGDLTLTGMLVYQIRSLMVTVVH